MDRKAFYYAQVPIGSDQLMGSRFAYEALGLLASDVIGTTTAVGGFACIPTSPASLSVKVGPGRVYMQNTLEATVFSRRASLGGLDADTATDHQIVKQGLMRDTKTLSCPAPGTSGFSIVYLLQAAFSESDSAGVSTSIYNPSNPASPTTEMLSRTRLDVSDVTVKAGTAATTGTQTAPSPDAGFIPLWTVTVANGQTQITAGNIAKAANSPFITSLQGAAGFATAAQIRAKDASLPINGFGLIGSAAYVALTDAATVTWDATAQGFNAKVTIAGNRTLDAISSVSDALPYVLRIQQDGTGSRTLSYNAQHLFRFNGGVAPTLSTGANKVDFLIGFHDAGLSKMIWTSFFKDS